MTPSAVCALVNWASVPPNRLPSGSNPWLSMNRPITRPRNSSGVVSCMTVWFVVMNTIWQAPATTSSTMASG